MKRNIPWLFIDFNEGVDHNHYLFSRYDTKKDIKGNVVEIYEGMEFYACDMDIEDGEYCLLVGDAIALLSSTVEIPDIWKDIRWICKVSNIRWEKNLIF